VERSSTKESMNKEKPKLHLDWCSYEAAKYACENWHYSKCMPAGKIAKIGIWENKKFIGSIMYGTGANPKIGSQYKLDQDSVCELVRVAIDKHFYPVSKYLSISLSIIKKSFPNMELVVSYADTRENHYGGIYQATNWIYVGLNQKSGGWSYKIGGKWVHKRSLGAKYGRRDTEFLDSMFPNAEKRKDSDKHKYLMPLKNVEKYEKLRKPYPKRVEHESNVSDNQLEESGAIPTDTLHLSGCKND